MDVNKLKKIYPIQTWINNFILRSKNQEVTEFNSELKEFSKILMELMWEYDWVWLAAPQIWKNIRVIAITQWKIKWDKWDFIKELVMINPVIISHSNETDIDMEWCLSLPWVEAKVKRYSKIRVSYYDVKWNKMDLSLSWMNARIVQHEIDHLNWILFIDKAIDLENMPIRLNNII